MQNTTIKTVGVAGIPEGQCAVRIDGETVYAGKLGVDAMRYLIPGATLYLSPEDFRGSMAEYKKWLN